jgi:hypothetical protein
MKAIFVPRIAAQDDLGSLGSGGGQASRISENPAMAGFVKSRRITPTFGP